MNGNPWTTDYLKLIAELDVDLRSNMSAEARAKMVYEIFIDFCDDPGSCHALQFLLTRESILNKALMDALESKGKNPPDLELLPPITRSVDLFFNDCGEGEEGDADFRGPWNVDDDFVYIEGHVQPIAESTAAEILKEGKNDVKSVTKPSKPAKKFTLNF